ncbi:Xanthine and CO dehydrogenase maturation factor, XdhC/CoxF family [Cnuella takakiae]|uniref:Xanthine and CO dehydrogenase maturation factor, XdhC/CoxF family n=1 Tax=Cnuella takakiae TaxID=1302690 RepID=A0A1M5CNH6_9BACT|nr:XdhC family protein [Cnuella takakiae]OLY91885.1 hypothetical protein BUE76_08225 [Cnuella takakiae]SHF56167.1 Xanthine and CO dehydrogenase maturation factor, XdhC/CoxF family [Cnuella takakiae]
MKEIKAIIDTYNQLDFTTTKAALATVSRVEGSSYRRAGARMLVLDNGNYVGGISGGCLEGDALRRAQKAIALGKPSVITYDTTQEDNHQIGVGLGCNGIIDVLFTPLNPADPQNPVRQLEEIVNTRELRLAITVTGGNDGLLGKMFLFPGEAGLAQTIPLPTVNTALLNDIKLALQEGQSQTCTYTVGAETIQVFIEVIRPATQLVIFGGNYDIYPMVRIAAELGWHTTVVMNAAKADKSLFTIANKVLHNRGDEQPAIDAHTAVILMAHDYATDFRNFEAALQTEAAYIGLLGPRKRTQKMLDALAEAGRSVSEQDWQRVFTPAGLDIGAVTPEEIALSIAAEIRMHFAGRKGTSLRERQGTIHGR